ncbi:MAG: hypothetical protein R6V73_02490 [Anaerolineales bacterium]
MVYRLKNEKDPNNAIHLTSETWYSILDLAEEYGWNPMGAVLPGQFQEYEYSSAGSYLGVTLNLYWNGGSDDGRLVVFEDALNMADALDQAFMEYEPLRVPASYFIFEPYDQAIPVRPSLGALSAVIEICRTGAFWIEPYYRVN